jgi:hypothetical protein
MESKKLLLIGGAAALALVVLSSSGKAGKVGALTVKEYIKRYEVNDEQGANMDEAWAGINKTSIEEAQKFQEFYLLVVSSDKKLNKDSPLEFSSPRGSGLSTQYLYSGFIGSHGGKNLYLYQIPTNWINYSIVLKLYLESQDTTSDAPEKQIALFANAFTKTNRYECLRGDATYTEVVF